MDWKEVHDRYARRIAAAGSEEERYGLVNRMLWELRVSHANLVPPGRLSRYEPLACAEGSPGLLRRLPPDGTPALGGAVAPLRVRRDGAAAVVMMDLDPRDLDEELDRGHVVGCAV